VDKFILQFCEYPGMGWRIWSKLGLGWKTCG